MEVCPDSPEFAGRRWSKRLLLWLDLKIKPVFSYHGIIYNHRQKGICAKKQREIKGDLWIRQEAKTDRDEAETWTEIKGNKPQEEKKNRFMKCQSVNPDLILTKNREAEGSLEVPCVRNMTLSHKCDWELLLGVSESKDSHSVRPIDFSNHPKNFEYPTNVTILSI